MSSCIVVCVWEVHLQICNALIPRLRTFSVVRFNDFFTPCATAATPVAAAAEKRQHYVFIIQLCVRRIGHSSYIIILKYHYMVVKSA